MIQILVGGQEAAIITGCGKTAKVIDTNNINRVLIIHAMDEEGQKVFGSEAQIQVEFRSDGISIMAVNQHELITLLRETYDAIATRCNLKPLT